MRRILPIVTSVLTFSLIITACTSAADSGEKATAIPSSNTTQTTTVPTDSSASPTSTTNTPNTDEGKETQKSGSQTDATQQKKNTSDQAKTSSPASPSTKKPSTTAKAPTSSPEKTSKPTQTTGGTKPSSSSLSAIEQEVVRLVNIERKKAGLKPLVADTKLSSVARIKSQDMRDNNYFDHQSPKYGSPFDMMKKFGISYRTAGENIAAGQTTAQQVMNSWMNSPGHRANILSANFTKIGVGFAKGGSYGTYWTQQFTG